MEIRVLPKLSLILSLCISISTLQAQYVALPDTGFGTWLNTAGYGCVTGSDSTGWVLDTVCSAALPDTIMYYDYYNARDLTGIQYFKNLKQLSCSGTSLALLPALPPLLTTLDCSSNPYLSSLPDLPASLISLNCSEDESLGSLPVLPSALISLDCGWNASLTSFPPLPSSLAYFICNDNTIIGNLPTLPSSLLFLQCDDMALSSLPSLPASLISLSCSNNQLTMLPTLPLSLNDLDCSKNQLDSLPTLSASLHYLDCSNNQLTYLPTLPASLANLYCFNNLIVDSLPNLPTSLIVLDCENNKLITLQTLPPRLVHFDCSANHLTSIPSLPATVSVFRCNSILATILPALPDSLIELDCNYDSTLFCLPRLPSSLQYITTSGTPISCLPNRVYATDLNPDLAGMPLCTPISGCSFYYNIEGAIHQDISLNCQADSLYPGNSVSNMKVLLLHNGQVVQQEYTLNHGDYSFKTDSLTTYTVTIDTTGLPLSVVCPTSGSHQVALSTVDTVSWGNNFGLGCVGFDYSVYSISAFRLRPAFTSDIYIGAGNRVRLQYNVDCGQHMPGTVTTILPATLHYISPASGALSPASVSGSTITYDIADLNALAYGDFNITVATDSNAVVGTQACITTIVSDSIADSNPGDDTLISCFNIVNSQDPNHKAVFPTDTFEPGQWLTYTIAFQNTGTDTAFTIVIKDTLSPNLDASSFQYLASDHKAVIQLLGSTVIFTFPKIDLVDSVSNPSLSTGWIQYKVKSNPDLAVQTQIKNTAYIYFDNNSPVVTNTTRNTVDTLTNSTGIATMKGNTTIHLYPNPNNGSFTLSTPEGVNKQYIIADMLGNIVTQQVVTSTNQIINMNEVANGIYTMQVKGAQPIRFTIVK